jgi:hypothetical protein
MIFAQSQPEGRVNPQKIGIVTIFIAGGNLEDPLTNHLD